MESKLKILENEHLVRDVKTNAVLNTDLSSLEKYRAKREREKKVSSTITELDNMKDEIKEIKSLLYQLLKEKNK
jgi:hypothetical protein